MSKVLRALFITAVATGVASVVLKRLGPPPSVPPPARPAGQTLPDTLEVDAERMTDEQRRSLMNELGEQFG